MRMYKCPFCDFVSTSRIEVNIHVYTSSDEIHGRYGKAPRGYSFNMIVEVESGEPKPSASTTAKVISPKLPKKIVCKNCGHVIKVDERSEVQFCRCGMYYRRRRSFIPGWTVAGWYKGERK